MQALQDARIAVRSLRRSPVFAATAIATLALGIGLATAVFTVAEALLLRDLPVRDQDHVVALWAETPDRRFANYPLQLEDAVRFGRGAQSLASAAFFGLLVAMLYEIPPSDGVTLMGAVAVIFSVVAAVAAGIPARASARTDPVVALRADG